MSLPRRRSLSVWFEDQPAWSIVVVILLLSVHLWYDLRHPLALLIEVSVVVILMVGWLLKALFDFEER
jgi:hypothetical protein